MAATNKGYNPLQYGDLIRKYVVRAGSNGEERLYSRFRDSNYYRKAMTGDLIGCNLRCKFCWADNDIRNRIQKPPAGAVFHSPKSVAFILHNKAKEKQSKYLRISQGEPTLSKNHVLSILEELNRSSKPKYPFILETNGIILGNDRDFAKKLSDFKNLHIRISLKGVNSKKFSYLTGAREEFYDLQLKAMSNCLNNGISFHPAIMIDFIDDAHEMADLKTNLEAISPQLIDKLEFERLILYPWVRDRLRKLNIEYEAILNKKSEGE